MQESPMALYCDFEAAQSHENGNDAAAEHKLTGFCIKPVTRFGLPKLNTITYSGKEPIDTFFKEITKFSHCMDDLYNVKGKEPMLLDKKSPEYKAHWRAKNCWICKQNITCKLSLSEFMNRKFSKSFEESEEDEDDTGEDLNGGGGAFIEDDEWMLGPKACLVKIY